MNTKKILSLLMAVAMVLSMVIVPAYAEETYALKLADANGNTTITAAAGSTVDVYLSNVGDNYPYYTGIGGYVTYPEGWSVSKTTNELAKYMLLNDISVEFTFTTDSSVNPLCLMWSTNGIDNGDGTSSALTYTGNLAKITFQIPEDAAAGTYDLTLDTAKNNANWVWTHDDNGIISNWDAGNNYGIVIPAINCQIVIPGAAETVECPEHGAVEWTEVAEGAWNEGVALEDGKHYKLTGDQSLSAAVTLAADTTACIDLNGCTISAAAAVRTIESLGSMVIMDSSENETGKIQGYNGIVSAGDLAGANIYIKGTMSIYGGTITGGQAVALTDGYAATSGNQGGNIYQASGTMNLYGGTITGGIARRGGNIYVSNGTFNMYGGTVTLGNADRGGNIYGDAVINIYGGTVSEGTCGWGGANLFTYGSSNKINVYGGQILGNCGKDAADGSLHGVYSNIYVYGGLIDASEGKNAAGAARTTVIASSGSATYGTAVTHIYGGTLVGSFSLASSNAENKIFNGKFSKDVSAYLTACACMEVTADGCVVWNYNATCTSCEYAVALTADEADDKYTITQQSGAHTAAASESSSTGYACAYCGTEVDAPSNTKEGACSNTDHGTVTWLPWDGASTNGHYYVEEDMTLLGQVTVASGEVLCLDLNGMTVTAAEGVRMFEVNGEFNLMDTAEGGKLVGTATATSASGAVVRSSNAFNFYSGTIVGGNVNVDSSSNYYAGSIYISGGTFYMYGGTVTGGKAINANATGAGGNLYLTGGSTTVISGGIIENGESSSYGGNIAVNTGAQVTITGDVIIRGGKASNGENVYVRGEKDGKLSHVDICSCVTVEVGASEAEDIFANADGQLDIAAGVVYYDSNIIDCVSGEAVLAETSGKYTTYETLTAALDAAGTADTVYLAKDVTVDGGVDIYTTLDLNGKTLVATGIVSAENTDAAITDSVGTGSATGSKVEMHNNNGMLAIDAGNNGVYSYETVTVAQKLATSGDAATLKFYIENAAEATKLDEAITAGSDVKIRITVTWNDGANTHHFNYNKELVAQYLADWDNKMFTCEISGLDEIGACTITAEVMSGNVVVAAYEAVTE